MSNKILVSPDKASTNVSEVTGSNVGTKTGQDVSLLGGSNEGILSGIIYDYAAPVYTGGSGEVETWTFRTGGSGGTIVAVVVVTYTDGTLETIFSVERTT